MSFANCRLTLNRASWSTKPSVVDFFGMPLFEYVKSLEPERVTQ